MRYLTASIISLFILLFVTNCAAPVAQKDPNARPAWVLNPPMDGKVYGIGSCGIHIKGVNMQRATAISMAIDEIARQNGVTVNSQLQRNTSVSNGTVNSRTKDYSIQTVDGQKINAQIQDVWQNPYNKKLYILMVQK